MPKLKSDLLIRAKKLIGDSNNFEVQTKADSVSVYCKSCEAKFKIDANHLTTQFQSHLRSDKHKTSKDSKTWNLELFVGKLDGFPSKPMLLTTMFLDKVNNTTIDSGATIGCCVVREKQIFR